MNAKKYVAIGVLGVTFGVLMGIAPSMQARVLAFLMWVMFATCVIVPRGDNQ